MDALEVWQADDGVDEAPLGPTVNTTKNEPEPRDGDDYEDNDFDEDADPDMDEDPPA